MGTRPLSISSTSQWVDVRTAERCEALLVDPVPGWVPRLASTSLELDELKKMEWLSSADRQAASLYKHDKRRHDFLLGRRAAYLAISDAFPKLPTSKFSIERGVFDQPVWTGQDIRGLSLSIAHSNGIGVALAAPPGFPVGLDLELVSDRQAKTMAKQMTDREQEALQEILPAESHATRLTTLWCAKEALSKALGCGLTCPLELMETQNIDRDGKRLSGTFRNFYQYRFHAWHHRQNMVLAMVMHRHHSLTLAAD